MSTQDNIPQQDKELQSRALAVQTSGNELVVRTQEDYDRANELCRQIKLLQKDVESSFDPICKKAHAAWKEAVAQKDRRLNPLKAIEQIIKDKMLIWYKAEEAKRKEQERKLAEKAEKKRKEAEAKAQEARDAGDDKKAEKYEDKASGIVAPTLAKTDTGTSVVSKRWSARVFDKKALLRAVLDGKVTEEAVEPNMSVLNALVRASKEATNIPGVQAIGEETIGVKTK